MSSCDDGRVDRRFRAGVGHPLLFVRVGRPVFFSLLFLLFSLEISLLFSKGLACRRTYSGVRARDVPPVTEGIRSEFSVDPSIPHPGGDAGNVSYLCDV